MIYKGEGNLMVLRLTFEAVVKRRGAMNVHETTTDI